MDFIIQTFFWSGLLFTIVLSVYGVVTRTWQTLAIGAGLSVILGLATIFSIGPYLLMLGALQGLNAWRIQRAQAQPPPTS